ncbi:MAG: AIR synthase family protein, partial [Firmicutes bacterium]|nr:AIR synthase family protein [Bacillota bacterium]MDY5857577.1 AIR synthase family protein [Anaerovoracaceae bacterium]
MLKTGKLDSDLLKQIVIDKINYKRPEVLTRAGVGEDCAVVDYGEYECVMSTDPITAAVSDIGRLAIHISCNDIASNGIQPLGIMLAVMLPVGTTEEDIETIMDQAAKAAEACQVEIIGGHTEITAAVNQPVIVSTAIGRGRKNQSASAENIQIGDVILMTKSAGLEGTGIIAGDYAEELKAILSPEELEQASELLDHVSVVRDGVTAGAVGTHGMHDVTEGGILGAVWEMCQIAGVGCQLQEEAIPVASVTRKICTHYGINYLRLISSGAMIIMTAPEKKEEMLQ